MVVIPFRWNRVLCLINTYNTFLHCQLFSFSIAYSLGCNFLLNTLKYLSTLEYISIHLTHTLVFIFIGAISQWNISLQALHLYSYIDYCIVPCCSSHTFWFSRSLSLYSPFPTLSIISSLCKSSGKSPLSKSAINCRISSGKSI